MLHYLLSLDVRMQKQQIDFRSTHSYSLKIIHANKKEAIYKEKVLKTFLAVLYFKASSLNFSSYKSAAIKFLTSFFLQRYDYFDG